MDSKTRSTVIYVFQDYYNLTLDSNLNDETLFQMNSRRCGVRDDFSNFHRYTIKWATIHLRWHYSYENPSVLEIDN